MKTPGALTRRAVLRFMRAPLPWAPRPQPMPRQDAGPPRSERQHARAWNRRNNAELRAIGQPAASFKQLLRHVAEHGVAPWRAR